MTEALEVRTAHDDMSEVVRELAPRVDDVSIRLPADRPIADGEWVRFTVLLRDGTTVFEGVGRSQGTKSEGKRFSVMLSLLQFDERNEIMYERMLLARDLSEEGEPTGTIDISELKEVESVSKKSSMPPPVPSRSSLPPARTSLSSPPKRPTSIPPPPPLPRKDSARPSAPPARASTRPTTPVAARAATPSRPPPKGREMPPKGSTPKQSERPKALEKRPEPRASEPPRSATPKGAIVKSTPPPRSAPPARSAVIAKSTPPSVKSAPPPKSAEPAKSAEPPKLPEPRPSEPAARLDTEREPRPKRDPIRIPIEEPGDMATFDTVVSRPEDLSVARGDRAIRLEIPARLVARARALAPTLPADMVQRQRGTPEENVLQAALRLGLASLAAMADVDDEG